MCNNIVFFEWGIQSLQHSYSIHHRAAVPTLDTKKKLIGLQLKLACDLSQQQQRNICKYIRFLRFFSHLLCIASLELGYVFFLRIKKARKSASPRLNLTSRQKVLNLKRVEKWTQRNELRLLKKYNFYVCIYKFSTTTFTAKALAVLCVLCSVSCTFCSIHNLLLLLLAAVVVVLLFYTCWLAVIIIIFRLARLVIGVEQDFNLLYCLFVHSSSMICYTMCVHFANRVSCRIVYIYHSLCAYIYTHAYLSSVMPQNYR